MAKNNTAVVAPAGTKQTTRTEPAKAVIACEGKDRPLNDARRFLTALAVVVAEELGRRGRVTIPGVVTPSTRVKPAAPTTRRVAMGRVEVDDIENEGGTDRHGVGQGERPRRRRHPSHQPQGVCKPRDRPLRRNVGTARQERGDRCLSIDHERQGGIARGRGPGHEGHGTVEST
jgi:hypothetical protein